MSTFNFFDSDYASNVITKRPHTGILSFFCSGLIKAFSMRHNNFGSSTFRSELVVLRIARDMIVELRIKLNSDRVPLKGLTDVYCNNQGVVNNMSVPEYTLNKKHHYIN